MAPPVARVGCRFPTPDERTMSMHTGRTIRRATLLVLSLLSACAANDFSSEEALGRSSYKPNDALGAFLVGRYAARSGDLEVAADKLERAARDSGLPEVEQQAFVASVLAGRPEAARLAARMPDNPIAQLVLADADAKAGRWDNAEARFAGLPQQGLTQVLRPLLIAWSQQGAGRTAAALNTLQPFLDAGRLRGVMGLHAALIADLGGQANEAARLYQLARTEYGGLNLRLAVILASWAARQGQVAEAQRIIAELTGSNGDLAIARLPLEADVAAKAVRRATDGIAEAYLAMAATLRQQNAADTAQVLLRLALAMRPDFTAARLLLADIQVAANLNEAALETLGAVPRTDPLSAIVRLRQAGALQSLGRTGDATRLLEDLAREYPDRPEPLSLAAANLRRGGQFTEAVALYDRAIARLGTPSRASWPLFYDRAVAHDRAGQWPEAERDFEYALKLAPDQPNVLNYLAYAWTEQNRNLDQAKRMLERAVEQRPDEAAFIDSLAWVLLRQGDSAAALERLERAVELEPEDPVINGHLGDALAAAGRWREAEYQWRRALTLKPEPIDAERINARLASLPASAPAEAAAAPKLP